MNRPRAVLVVLAALVLSAVPARAGGDPLGFGAQPVVSAGTSGDTATGAVGFTQPGGDVDTGSGQAAPAGPPTRPTVERQTVQLPGPCAPKPDLPSPKLLQDQVRVLPGGTWRPTRTYCEGDPLPAAAPPEPDPEAARQTAVFLRAQVRAPRPALRRQPATAALVRTPAIFRLADPGTPPGAVDTDPVVGFEVRVTLGAPSYEWSFGDGVTGTSGQARGRAYTQGDRVPPEGRGTPLVTHTYSAAGEPLVSVTAVYPVTFTWNGTTQQLDPVRATSQVRVPVREARSELVSR